MVRLLGFDLTHKLRIIFHSNCYVQLSSLREITKRNSRHLRIQAETLTRLLCKQFQEVLLVVSWNCSLYGKSPQNNQHQEQTKLRFHSFLYKWAQLDLKKNKLRNVIYDLIFENQNRTRKHLATSKITSKILELHKHFFMSYLSLEPETTDPSEISQRYLSSR